MTLTHRMAAGLISGLIACVACFGQAEKLASPLVGGELAGLPLLPHPHGQGPEVQLYPGGVEHYRAYFMKYLPVRSFFDQQSQLSFWSAPYLPGAPADRRETFAAPIYQIGRDATGQATGKFQPAVPVIRASVKAPVITLDLGQREPGLYCVRVIGAVQTDKLRRFRLPLFVTMTVNDGLKGEVSTYRKRVGYVDDFYSIGEFYFHAPAARTYQAQVFVDQGSQVDLLIQGISLDDALVGTIRKPLKRGMTMHSAEQLQLMRDNLKEAKETVVARIPKLTPEQRLQRDRAIWRWIPPTNAQGLWLDFNVPSAPTGSDTQTIEEIEAAHGKWDEVAATNHNLGGLLFYDAKFYNTFLVNRKLGLEYTLDDLYARKTLPDPYPYKADGAGLYFPDPAKPDQGRYLDPIAYAVGMRYRNGYGMAASGARLYQATGNKDVARDAAINLIRYAYDYPTICTGDFLSAIVAQPGPYDREYRCRQREAVQTWLSHYQNYTQVLYAYDLLFDYIKGNDDLAKSIQRFIPWVKNADDLIMLLDVYLVQHQAKRILRYHDHTLNMGIAEVAICLGDRQVTDPWMQWLFDRTFVYPLQPAGIQDLAITGCDRSGPEYIGSTYYAQGEGASRTAAELEPYIRAGGDPKYSLADLSRYPKSLAHCYWQLGLIVGGRDFLRIGDVTGPDKMPGYTFGSLGGASRNGWRWSGDPAFAWMLANHYGRAGETDAQWQEIQKAASALDRAPWLNLRSRLVPNWAGVLEAGLEHDDYRLRRTAYVRTGMGIGHQHADTLDLQIVAHGLPMTIDDGQRSGYSKPNSRFTRIHNAVDVDGWGNEEYGLRSHAWTTALADLPGAGYLSTHAMPGRTSTYHQRQVALVDVNPNPAPVKFPTDQQKPGAKLPPVATPANSYVFDVYRVAGGSVHTYSFHGMVNDDFQWNAVNTAPIAAAGKEQPGANSESQFVSIFSQTKSTHYAGDAPEVLTATWRYTRQGTGSEQHMLGANFDPQSPRKFTRLHLTGVAGLRALRADVAGVHDPITYTWTNLMAQKRGKDLQSAFAAVIEPYAGEPFLQSVRALSIPANESDALAAVAVEVKTASGQTDVCFADGRPEKTRTVGDLQVAGEYAYVSSDAQGLRQASLAGGTLLQSPAITLQTALRQRTAKVTQVNYSQKTFQIDQAWPTRKIPMVVQIGLPERLTAYTINQVKPLAGGAQLTADLGADYYRSRITGIKPEENRVDCVLNIPLGKIQGFSKNLVASNDQATKFWLAEHLAGNDFKLTGAPLSKADFEPEGVLRLWEYGMGDAVTQTTSASLRRLEPGLYELTADVDLTLTLPAASVEVSRDGQTWIAAKSQKEKDRMRVSITTADLGENLRLLLRVK